MTVESRAPCAEPDRDVTPKGLVWAHAVVVDEDVGVLGAGGELGLQVF